MNIYIAHSRNFNFQKELYEPLRQSDLNNKHTFVLPHELSQKGVKSQDYLKKDCDIIIAEVSYPSIGLGIELGWADIYKVPIACIYKKGIKYSDAITSVTDNFLEYESDIELISKIEQIIKEIN